MVRLAEEQEREAVALLAQLLQDAAARKRRGPPLPAVPAALWTALLAASSRFRRSAETRVSPRDPADLKDPRISYTMIGLLAATLHRVRFPPGFRPAR